MTTSTTIDYNDNRNQIIQDSLILLGIYGSDDSMSSNDTVLASRFLNRMIKSWESTGAHIWSDEVARVWLQDGQREYSLGAATSDDHWAIDYVETALSLALADNATAVTVTSTTGMTIGDKIGVVMDTNGVFWTTIATIPTSTTLTLTSGVTETCSVGSLVYTYTNRPQRPLRILQASLVSQSDDLTNERPINQYSFEEYQNIPSKFTPGSPNVWMYKAKLTSGILTLWNIDDDLNDRVSIHYQRPLFDFDEGTDTSDFPQEWLEAAVYGLAVRLAPAYGKTDLLPSLKAMADEMFDLANSYDQENVVITLPTTREGY